MPWCPQCKNEYVVGTTTCPDCEVELVAVLPPEDHDLENYVLIANAPDQQTAELIAATLDAAGIPTLLQHDALGPAEGMLPHLGLAWNRGVAVPAEREQEARALLQSLEPTEAELIAEEEADPTTLEEAEARVREA
jgi:hypothetical protein